jgi:hypothetical protein
MRDYHPMTTKKIGDRVKVPKHPADYSRGYFFGTVIHRGPSDNLLVQWDENIPYMSNPGPLMPAILV